MQVSNKITYRVPCQAWTWQANWTFRIPCWEIRSIVAHMAEQASQFQGAGVKLAPIMCTPCLASSIESCLESSINPRPKSYRTVYTQKHAIRFDRFSTDGRCPYCNDMDSINYIVLRCPDPTMSGMHARRHHPGLSLFAEALSKGRFGPSLIGMDACRNERLLDEGIQGWLQRKKASIKTFDC
eukprot:1159270-Pelagomonas_calceolata.AAC.1